MPLGVRYCRDEERERDSWRELEPETRTGEALALVLWRLKSSERVCARGRECGGGFVFKGIDSGIQGNWLGGKRVTAPSGR